MQPLSVGMPHRLGFSQMTMSFHPGLDNIQKQLWDWETNSSNIEMFFRFFFIETLHWPSLSSYLASWHKWEEQNRCTLSRHLPSPWNSFYFHCMPMNFKFLPTLKRSWQVAGTQWNATSLPTFPYSSNFLPTSRYLDLYSFRKLVAREGCRHWPLQIRGAVGLKRLKETHKEMSCCFLYDFFDCASVL